MRLAALPADRAPVGMVPPPTGRYAAAPDEIGRAALVVGHEARQAWGRVEAPTLLSSLSNETRRPGLRGGSERSRLPPRRLAGLADLARCRELAHAAALPLLPPPLLRRNAVSAFRRRPHTSGENRSPASNASPMALMPVFTCCCDIAGPCDKSCETTTDKYHRNDGGTDGRRSERTQRTDGRHTPQG